MPQLIIEMTEAELFALDLIALDRQAWADNALTERARVAKEELKGTAEWTQAAISLGDPDADDWAILMQGKTLGLFKTAAQKHAEFLANMPNPAEPIPTDPVEPGTYNLPKQQPFIRATEEESEQLEALLNSAPARLRMIYQGATHINSGDELFGTLMAMIASVLGEARALELLAPL